VLDKSRSECTQLWAAYTSATAAHLKLKGQMDTVLYDAGLYEIARRATELAKQHQEAALVKFKEHETRCHPSSAEISAKAEPAIRLPGSARRNQ
jgi:hypothetical protein